MALPLALNAQAPAGKAKSRKTRPAAAASAPQARVKVKVAANLVADPDRLDLGEVDAMKVVHFAVKLRNQGKVPVQFKGVGVSCGCTTPNPFDSQHLLQAGGEHVVQVDFNPAGLSGTVSRMLTFQSDDPLRPQFQLVFTAQVKTAAIPQPEVLVIDGDEGGKPTAQPIRFVPVGAALDPASLVIEDAAAPLKVAFEKALGGEIHGTLTLDPALLKAPVNAIAGQQRTRLILTGKDGQKAAMTVVWAVRPAFWVSPGELVTSTGVGQAFVTYATIVFSKPVKILQTEVSIPGVEAIVTQGDTVNSMKLQVRGHGGEKGDMKAIVKVHSDSPVHPDLEIPLTIHVI